MLTTYQQLIQI